MEQVEKWQWIITDQHGLHYLTRYFFTEEKARQKAIDTGDTAVKAEWTRIVVDVK